MASKAQYTNSHNSLFIMSGSEISWRGRDSPYILETKFENPVMISYSGLSIALFASDSAYSRHEEELHILVKVPESQTYRDIDCNQQAINYIKALTQMAYIGISISQYSYFEGENSFYRKLSAS